MDKREKLAALLARRKKINENNAMSEITRHPERDVAPIALSQKRLWFINQLEEVSGHYNICIITRVKGPFNPHIAEQALQHIVDRHQPLRTVFVRNGDDIHLHVNQDVAIHIQHHKLSSMDDSQRQVILAGEQNYPFDLKSDLMLRASYISYDENVGELILGMHHIASDGWSMQILVNEFFHCYECLLNQQPIALPPLEIEYSDFAHWQKKWMEAGHLDSVLDYWQHTLANLPPVHSIPLDKKRPPIQSFEGDTCELCIDKSMASALRELAIQHQVTLFMLLHGLFSIVVSKLSNSADVVIGTPIAGRNQRKLEPLIGFFVNTLILRLDCDKSLTLSEFFQQVKQVNLSAQDNQQVPFELIVERLNPARNQAYSPLFQIMFSIASDIEYPRQLGEAQIEPFEAVNEGAKFDLSLTANERENGELLLCLNYNVALFERASIERMLAQIFEVAKSAIRQPNAPIQALTHLSDTAINALIHLGYEAIDVDQTLIHELFEQQAQKTPHAMAIVAKNEQGYQTLSYQELNAQANQLARYLAQQGVKPGDLVGVCQSRSAALPVSLLAVLKLGAAYVSLDPKYPRSRLYYMMDNAKLALVLTETAINEELQLAEKATIVALNDANVSQAIAACEANNVPRDASLLGDNQQKRDPNDLAYVIYTSGSTGQPKGVMINHKALVILIRWALDYFSADELRCVLASTSLNFDLSSFELFVPLACGGSSFIVENILSVGHLQQAPVNVSLINTVPSAIQTLLNDKQVPDTVQTVNLAGEKLSRTLVNQLLALPQIQRVANLYGPSEDTTYSTGMSFSAPLQREPLIGKPVYNTRAYVLDADLALLPMGALGELYLAGDGLSLGYINRPDLTAERFLTDPFCGEHSAKMYKTGDLVRWTHQGELEYLGRADNQIKLRGFRVELEEIESQLRDLDEVENGAVILWKNTQGEDNLVAYIKPVTSAAPLHKNSVSKGVKTQLKAVLPDYMVPDIFVFLDDMPLTPNGKVDRKALPAPEEKDLIKETFVAGRNPLEVKLCEHWAALLGLAQVGIHDNFFSLGGHSLLAERFINWVRNDLGVSIPLRSMFEQPTVANIAHCIQQLERTAQPSAMPNLVAVDPHSQVPLSYSQQRLWMLDQLQSGLPLYNMSQAFDVFGEFNVDAAKRALEWVVARHDIFKSRYVSQGDTVYQHRCENSVPVFTLVDLSDATSDAWQTHDSLAKTVDSLPDSLTATLQNTLQQASLYRFDLRQDVLIRLLCVKVTHQHWVLHFNMHHICSDAWSLGVLLNTFCERYAAFAGALLAHTDTPLLETPSPEPLPVQYRDYAVWQRQQLTEAYQAELLAFWKNTLADSAPLHALPLDFPRPEQQSHAGKNHVVMLDLTLSEQLNNLAKDLAVTPFILTQSLFALLLSRFSQEDDILMGTPVNGRALPEFENLIGFFVNTLVLRTHVNPELAFCDFVAANKNQVLSAFEHQHIPFEMLVEALNPERSLSYSPLFQIMFDYQVKLAHGLSLAGAKTQMRHEALSYSKFDLTLTLIETDAGLKCEWEYATDLFSEQSIMALADTFRLLALGVVQQPNQALYQYALTEASAPLWPVLPAQVTPNLATDTALENKPEQAHNASIVALFERHVALQGEQIALIQGSEQLSYQALNEKAQRFANWLAQTHPDCQRVGLCVSRSVDALVALLGILKQGAAYVPLDPAYPTTRLAYMIDDAQLDLVITQSDYVEKLPTQKVALLCLEDSAPLLGTSSTTTALDWASVPDLASKAQSQIKDLGAYVIYTSGSTGQPKGVSISHGNWLAYFRGIQAEYGLQAERVLQFSSMSFDIFTEELSMSWLTGGTLVLQTQDTAPSSSEFWDLVKRHRISAVSLPTAYWHLLADDPELALLAHNTPLTKVIVGGEAMSAQALSRWQKATLPVRVFNTYGPTETTVVATVCDVSQLDARARAVPIGHALDGQPVFVLDRFLQPVPKGAIGELCVGGAAVSQGYVGQNTPAQAHFCNFAYQGVDYGRIYRTGDRVRLHPDGNLDFYGRADHQIKIRGFRVELGEIEAQLAALAGVKSCLVLPKHSAAGNRFLAAYVIPTQAVDSPEKTCAELRHQLQSQLPHYMVPDALILLDTWPLRVNGKIDTSLLPDAQLEAGHFAAPETHVEKRLAGLWQKILGVAVVGRDDHFFHVGGHSLLAIQLSSLVRQDWAIELPIHAIFKHPTLRAMAAWIVDAGVSSRVPDIDVVNRDQPLVLSYAQQRLWFIHQLEGRTPQYNMCGAYRVQGRLDAHNLRHALQQVSARQESLRTRFAQGESQAVQVIDNQAALPFIEHDLRALPKDEQDATLSKLMQDDAQYCFDLQNELLWRVQLIQLADDQSVLLFNMHHIISDGWSMGVLVNEFVTSYQALITQQNANLPALPVQYADYAKWQRDWLQAGELDRHLDYWQSQLAGMPAVHGLPLDHPRPANQSFAGAVYQHTLAADVMQQVQALAKENDATLFMVLQTAFALLIGRYGNETDIVVGSPLAGRHHHALEGLIGFFVNTVVIRTDVSGKPTFTELLARNKNTILAAYHHEQVPFEQVVEAVNPVRSRSHSPLCQIIFSLQNHAEEVLSLSDVSLTPLLPSTRLSKFDITASCAADTDVAGAYVMEWEYCCDLFESATIKSLAQSFEQLLRSIVQAPHTRIDKLALLSEDDIAQRVYARQPITLVAPDYPRIEHWVSAQAKQSPDKVALVSEAGQLTYAQLDALSDTWAAYLITQGVNAKSRVGSATQRSHFGVVSMLATVKAGATYVPLDPDSPAARLAHIIDDSGLQILLTQHNVAAVFAEFPVLSVCMDEKEEALTASALSTANGNQNAKWIPPDVVSDIAYIIYTSGTTGLPKGVEQTHDNVLRLLSTANSQDYFGAEGGLGRQDVWTLFHSTAFDFSVWEIWGALCLGGTLVIPNKAQVQDTDRFVTLCKEQGVTVLNQTPSAFKTFMQAVLNRGVDLPALRFVIFGGEALQPDTLTPWFHAFPSAPSLINMYGITETTVHVTYKKIDASTGANSLIGRALGDQAIYLLDEHLQPVPDGAVGEMYVGGAGLSPGYVNRQALTDERFLANPYASPLMQKAKLTRLYRTGDLARYTADLELSYLGRNDAQVKIRGYRIELGEVEYQVRQLPYVSDALVQLKQDARNEPMLVAYVIPAGETRVVAQDWRADIAAKVPSYMVPAAWVELAQWPLTVNGKIDKHALPEPALLPTDYAAPLSDEEQVLTQIWSQILGVEARQISRNDNFFNLGGHSLLMLEYRKGLSDAGYDFSIAELYQASDLKSMAAKLTGYTAQNQGLVGEQSSQITGQMANQTSPPPPTLCEVGVALTPAQFPMVSLTQEELDTLCAQVAGGADNIQDIYPLSPLQEGMLFHSLQSDEADPYLVESTFKCQNTHAFNQLVAALNLVVSRHDALRTQIVVKGTRNPLQVVCRQACIPVSEAGVIPDDVSDISQWLQDNFTLKSLPLDKAPLLHLYRYQAKDGIYAVLYNHHIVEDNYSGRIVTHEVEGFLQDKVSLLPEPVPYRDFIWHGRQLDLMAARDAFKASLAGLEEPSYPYGVATTQFSARKTSGAITLSLEESHRIKAFAKAQGVSISALMHLAWSLVVAQTSNRQDVVFGTVFSGRMQQLSGMERMVGLCINTLPIRLKMSQDSLAKRLKDTQAQLQSLLSLEQVPLTEAQAVSPLGTSQPLFSSVLNCRLQQTHTQDNVAVWEQAGIEVVDMAEYTNYPAAASVNFNGEAFNFTVAGSGRVDGEVMVDYFVSAIRALLAQAQQPDAPLVMPALLSEPERARLQRINQTQQDYPRDATLPELFNAQMTWHKSSLAVVCGDRSLTYQALHAEASTLAKSLMAAGIQPNDKVGLMYPRQSDLLVAVWAVLFAGATYVPLVASYPDERLTHMIEDCHMTLLLVDASLVTRAQSLPVTQSTATQLQAQVKDYNALPALPTVQPEQLAYVVYTSGSTGKPKGVAVTHRNVVSLACNNPFIDMTQARVFLGVSNIAFDGSVFDVFVSLLNGRKLVFLDDTHLTQPALWADLCALHQVDTAFITTALFNHLVNEKSAVLPHLKQLLFGGEQINLATVDQYLQQWPQNTLYHVYGPTETTVYATCTKLTSANKDESPIGSPLYNKTCYVLDAQRNLLPYGVVGELYIGGEGVAQGYLNQPALTAERFIDDPFSTQAGAKLYRTGDLVRWRDDGTLVFAGRVDNQVKIRGFRIELEEVESALSELDSVKECSVQVYRHESGQDNLVGFVVTHNNSVTPETLRAALSVKMPDYMIPTWLIKVDALPLTPNGKVDKKVLQEQVLTALQQGQLNREAYTAPDTDTERSLAELWRQLLRLEHTDIGRESSFFELGGNSLLIMRLSNEIQAQFDVSLSVKELFEYQKLSALAELIDLLKEMENADDHKGADEKSEDEDLSITL